MELELHDLLLAEFEENGDGPNYNCWNLCREIYRRAGKFLPRYSDYIAGIAERDNLIKAVQSADFVRVARPEPLAIVTFRLNVKATTHMGIVLDKHKFIHVRKKTGVSIERLDIGLWPKKIEGFYRYAGNHQA